jgi:4-hydroxy-3-methylbut-2-en-1-yl diphosphate synthase IspG/GcpE
MHFDTAVVEVFIIGGVVNELGELPLTHLGCSPAENKEEGVDSVRLARTVRSNDGRERLREKVKRGR